MRHALHLLVAAAALPTTGCAGGSAGIGTYEACLREPASYGDGRSRSGTIGRRGFVDREAYAQSGVYQATISRARCLDSVWIHGPGVELRGGPWRPLWDESFTAHDDKHRVAFAYYADEHVAHVWVDGRVHGPYREIIVAPELSDDGAHVAWAASLPDGDAVLVVDGRPTPTSAKIRDLPFFYVLDDGRVAASFYLDDRRVAVTVGGWSSGPLEEMCGDGHLARGPKSRWAFTAKRDGSWFTVVDGKQVSTDEVPTNCAVAFSDDGAHWAFVGSSTAGGTARRRRVVLDGTAHAVDEGTVEVSFFGRLPIAVANRQDQPGSNGWERLYTAVGVPTPAAAPTVDQYEPARDVYTTSWARVRIGASVGPKLDRVEGLEIDAEGHVRYRGTRGGSKVEIVDNVIQVERPARVPAIAE